MKKSSTLYKIVFLLWTLCVGLLGFGTYRIIVGLEGYSPVVQGFIIALLCLNSCILASLWFGSVKDVVFSVAYAIYGKKLCRRYEEVERFRNIPLPEPRVLLLYCTRNDFNNEALSLSMKQNYRNFATVILDDRLPI